MKISNCIFLGLAKICGPLDALIGRVCVLCCSAWLPSNSTLGRIHLELWWWNNHCTWNQASVCFMAEEDNKRWVAYSVEYAQNGIICLVWVHCMVIKACLEYLYYNNNCRHINCSSRRWELCLFCKMICTCAAVMFARLYVNYQVSII